MDALLQEKLDNLPTAPGVYQHKDGEGNVLYVGKAKNLRNRVRSYFQESRSRDGRMRLLTNKIEDVEVIVTDTEVEALILENNLIKQLRPRYNVNLKDDKSYPYICIKDERFPRVFSTRQPREDGSEYFGPYTDVGNMKRVLKTIRSVFKLRSCSHDLTEEKIEAGAYETCLDYHIEQCAAPCVGYQSETDYDRTIERIKQLLNGHTQELIEQLEQEMEEASEALEFEKAANIRDQVDALKQYSNSQKMISQDRQDRDLFAVVSDTEADVAASVLFKVREGKIIGRQHKYLRKVQDRSEEELMQTVVENFYTDASFFPDEVLTNVELDRKEPLEKYLWGQRGKKVRLHVPQRGEKAKLVRMVQANARLLLGEFKLQREKQKRDRVPHSVRALERDLRLGKLPRHIECFDVSHLGGTETVASCVVFQNGKPKKSEYRRYKINNVEGRPDDYEAMREVVRRRCARVMEEDGAVPDLIIIDGGKGQLSSAIESMKDVGFYGEAAVIGLAKRLEEVYLPGNADPTHLSKSSSSLRLLQQARDEAHRFAVSYQRKRRKNMTLQTELLDIRGIGPKTVQKLYSHFGSPGRVREADEGDLSEVVGPAKARKIAEYYDA
jgi:excinuclease ABC subunit C